MAVKDTIELPVSTTLTYEMFQLLEGHVLQLAIGHQDRAILLDIDRPESVDFIAGFEVGLLMGRLSGKPSTWRGGFHVVSGAMLERAATALGYRMKSEPPWADGVWMFCDFTRISEPEYREER